MATYAGIYLAMDGSLNVWFANALGDAETLGIAPGDFP
jgi:hypothetical protein